MLDLGLSETLQNLSSNKQILLFSFHRGKYLVNPLFYLSLYFPFHIPFIYNLWNTRNTLFFHLCTYIQNLNSTTFVLLPQRKQDLSFAATRVDWSELKWLGLVTADCNWLYFRLYLSSPYLLVSALEAVTRRQQVLGWFSTTSAKQILT